MIKIYEIKFDERKVWRKNVKMFPRRYSHCFNENSLIKISINSQLAFNNFKDYWVHVNIKTVNYYIKYKYIACLFFLTESIRTKLTWREDIWLSEIEKSEINVDLYYALKGVFTKNERGYRLNAIKKRFWSLLILLLSVASIRRTLLKTSHTE